MSYDVADLAERARIIDRLTELFVATDEKDWEKVESCFDDEVRFDMTSLSGGEATVMTPVEIVDMWRSGLGRVDAVHHQVGNFRVERTVERAKAFCYGIAYHFRKTASGRNTRLFVGSYDFSMRVHHGDWRISTFTFHAKFVDGNLTLEDDPA